MWSGDAAIEPLAVKPKEAPTLGHTGMPRNTERLGAKGKLIPGGRICKVTGGKVSRCGNEEKAV